MKKIVLFSKSDATIKTWQKSLNYKYEAIGDANLLNKEQNSILLCDSRYINVDVNADIIKNIINNNYVIIMSANPNLKEGLEYLQNGVRGYANMYIAPDNLNSMIKIVANGNIWLNPNFVNELIANSKNKNKTFSELSKKENEVAKLVRDGLSNKEIAKELDITEITVKRHLSSIYSKLNIKNRLSLAVL